MRAIFSPTAVKVLKASATPGDNIRQVFNFDSDKVHNQSQKIVPSVEVAGRPSNILYKTTSYTSYWWQYALVDYYNYDVSIMSTIINRSNTEIYRYGIDWEGKFARKCVNCGYESKTNVKQCPECGSFRMRKPEEKQKEYFVNANGNSFLDEANESGQSLKDVCRAYTEMQYLYNFGHVLCVTGDIIDKNGQLIQSYPLEFLPIDPKFVKLLYDGTAKLGDNFAFTQEDRHQLINFNPDDKEHFHTTDEYTGKVLYPAYYQVGESWGASGKYWLYTKGEIYNDKWFTQSLTYGKPIWFNIEDDLLTYHYLEKHNLKLYEYGYLRKIIILPGFDDIVAKDVAQGVQDVLALNDNSIPIVALPPQIPGTPEQKAQVLDLGSNSGSDTIQTKNEIRDRCCAFVGVPNLFAGDVSGSGGLNNETQQITTFDRYLSDKYDYADKLLKWFLSWFPKITDWELKVVRPAKADTEVKALMEKAQLASQMKNIGIPVAFVNGDFEFGEVPMDKAEETANNVKVGTRDNNAFMSGTDEADMTQDSLNDVYNEADNAIMASKSRSYHKHSLRKVGTDNSFRIPQRNVR